MVFRFIVAVCIIASFTGAIARAQVMQSASYRIESDSMNMGGARSTSGSYSLEDTAGEVGTGESSSTSYQLGAGYQQMLEDYLAMTAPADVTMSPALGGLTGGTSNGSTAVTVTTDSAAGYQLLISASSSPALQSPDGDQIADYVPGGANPDYDFTVAAGQAFFGYSPEGADIASRFEDDTALCGTGGTSDTSLKCWDGLSITPEEFARRTSGNHPSGTVTTLQFRVGLGANAAVTEGMYTATTTITALSL